MSRGSVRTFLVSAKRHLQQSLQSNSHISLVIGNESADLDSIACALLYGYIQSSQPEARRSKRIIVPVTNIPSADLFLRPELTALLSHAGIRPAELITLDDLPLSKYPLEKTDWVLVDHNVFLGSLGRRFSNRVTGVIDHHEDEQHVPASAQPRVITKAGSCSSLVAKHCRPAWEALASTASTVGAAHAQDDALTAAAADDAAYTHTWDAQAAKLALGAVLIDTAALHDKYKTTAHDSDAVRFLEALVHASPKLGPSYDRAALFAEISDAKANLDALSLYDVLRKDYKEWAARGLTLGTAAVVRSLEYLRAKGDDFDETLVRFAKERSLSLLAVMTAYTTETGEFARQLCLIAIEEGKAKQAAERFATRVAEEFELEDLAYEKPHSLPFARAWAQKNLAASRKQVAPLLREAMR